MPEEAQKGCFYDSVSRKTALNALMYRLIGDAEYTEELRTMPTVCKVRSVCYTEGDFWILLFSYLLMFSLCYSSHLTACRRGTHQKHQKKGSKNMSSSVQEKGIGWGRIKMSLIVH